MKDVIEIIREEGPGPAMAALGFSGNYGHQLLSGRRALTRGVIVAALRAWPGRVDLTASVRRMLPDASEARIQGEVTVIVAMAALPTEAAAS